MKIALWLTYDGAPFSGFARQNDQLTVQGNLEDALAMLFHREVETTCAGRTDAGVHALCQVVSFDLFEDEWLRRKPETLLRSLNALTEDEISIRRVRPMPEDFSARFSAVSREYRYYVCIDEAAPLLMNQFCWHLGKSLDVAKMKAAAQYLLGEHDFKSFCMAVSAKSKPTHRYVGEIEFSQEQIWKSSFVVIKVVGNAFLHSMVRTMVGTLVLVGQGKREPEWVQQVLEARDRQAAGQNAPAQGLVLWNVEYPESAFHDLRPSQLLGQVHTENKLTEAIDDVSAGHTAAAVRPSLEIPDIGGSVADTEPLDAGALAGMAGHTSMPDQQNYPMQQGDMPLSFFERLEVVMTPDPEDEWEKAEEKAKQRKKSSKGGGKSFSKIADNRWAQRKQDKEWAKGFSIPRGPNLESPEEMASVDISSIAHTLPSTPKQTVAIPMPAVEAEETEPISVTDAEVLQAESAFEVGSVEASLEPVEQISAHEVPDLSMLEEQAAGGMWPLSPFHTKESEPASVAAVERFESIDQIEEPAVVPVLDLPTVEAVPAASTSSWSMYETAAARNAGKSKKPRRASTDDIEGETQEFPAYSTGVLSAAAARARRKERKQSQP